MHDSLNSENKKWAAHPKIAHHQEIFECECLHNEVILLVSLQDKVKTSIQKSLDNQDNHDYDKYNK